MPHTRLSRGKWVPRARAPCALLLLAFMAVAATAVSPIVRAPLPPSPPASSPGLVVSTGVVLDPVLNATANADGSHSLLEGVAKGFALYMRVQNATEAAASAAFRNDTRDALAEKFQLPNTPRDPITTSGNATALLQPGIYIRSINVTPFPMDNSTAANAPPLAVAVTFDVVVSLEDWAIRLIDAFFAEVNPLLWWTTNTCILGSPCTPYNFFVPLNDCPPPSPPNTSHASVDCVIGNFTNGPCVPVSMASFTGSLVATAPVTPPQNGGASCDVVCGDVIAGASMYNGFCNYTKSCFACLPGDAVVRRVSNATTGAAAILEKVQIQELSIGDTVECVLPPLDGSGGAGRYSTCQLYYSANKQQNASLIRVAYRLHDGTETVFRATSEHHFFLAAAVVPYAQADMDTPPAALKRMDRVAIGDLVTVQDATRSPPVFYTTHVTSVHTESTHTDAYSVYLTAGGLFVADGVVVYATAGDPDWATAAGVAPMTSSRWVHYNYAPMWQAFAANAPCLDAGAVKCQYIGQALKDIPYGFSHGLSSLDAYVARMKAQGRTRDRACIMHTLQAQVASGRVFASMAEALEASASCYQRTACQGEEVAVAGSAGHRVNGTTLEVAGVWGVLPLPLMSGTA